MWCLVSPQNSYVAALNKKLNEVSKGVSDSERTAALREVVERDVRPVTPPCEREEDSWRPRPCANGNPAGSAEAAPLPRPVDSAAGYGLSQEALHLVRPEYKNALTLRPLSYL